MVKKSRLDSLLSRKVSNRLSYTIISFFAVLLLSVFVYAVGPAVNPGHLISQIQTCDTNGQVMKMSNGAWTCAADADTRCDVSGTCNQLCIGTNCQTSWPSGGSSQWTTVSGGIYYNDGTKGVGIGTTNSTLIGSRKLVVAGGESNFNSGTTYTDPHYNVVYDAKFGGSNRGIAVGGNSFFASAVGVGTNTPIAMLQVCITNPGSGVCGAGNTMAIGNDLIFADVDVQNVLGLRGNYDSSKAGLQFGASGPTLSGSTATSSGTCSGFPQACGMKNEASCEQTQGCDWAESISCNTIPTEFECDGDFGGWCSWDEVHDICMGDLPGECYGTPNACSTYGNSNSCENAIGCDWTNTGTPATLSVDADFAASGNVKAKGYSVAFVVAGNGGVCSTVCSSNSASCYTAVSSGGYNNGCSDPGSSSCLCY